MKTLALVLAAVLFVTLENVVGVSDETLGRPFISSALAEAKSRVDQAYKYTRDLSKTKYKKRSLSPSDLLSFFKQPAADTRSAVRAAEYMENTLSLITQRVHKIHRRSLNATDILTPEDLSVIARLTGCEARITVPSCNTNALVDKYRTITSVCNNKRNPRLGASNTPLSRWLPSQYEDGVHLPKGWDPNRLYSGFHLPLARAVSNHILHTANDNLTQDNDFAYMLVLFGQWADHDLDITPTSPSVRSFNKGIHCDESCDQASPCFPIKIPPNDTRIHDTDSCIPFFRSAPACGTGTTGYMFGNANTREQINALTSFVDASMVYGSEEPLSRKLRNLKSDLGLMAVNDEFRDDGLEFLPFNKMEMNMCATRRSATSDQSLSEVECFHAGDARANENIGLTAIHTLFVREHNRLARRLKKLNPHWNGEILFQEARKIMGAYHQILIYGEYLPRIVGREAVDTYLKTYSGYDESVDPGVANVFSTAAFRFAHLTIQPFMFRLNETFQEHPEYPSVLLHKAFFTPWRLVFEGGVDPILRGLIGKPAKLNTQDKMMHEELRERLFKLTSHLALDLGSLNIQRSRDHGLPGYNDWRRFCGLSEPKTVDELAAVLNNRNLAVKLLGLYGSPDNIDIWMGGISEPFASNARVGPLFACLIATQFQKIRNGDRFWWENSGTFTESQRNSLRTVSLSRIICDNTKIQEVPENAFQYRPYSQGYTRCSQIPSFDLSPWQENTSGTTEHPEQTGGSASSAPQGPKGAKGDSEPEGMKGDIGPAGPPEPSRPPGPSGPPEPARPPGPSGPEPPGPPRSSSGSEQ
ncbi:myeloperoxidase-like [Acipenser oxyrinchus oxyrinchus]|uniref:Myeloperoxidase-like n=1 Tax=Acipenser oxyrinchus oxyrinchus TaxID=40147 RepID=A0AAD8CM73_ACIOX|nr:myeloperoxidase-like [Acipenser oxyrinchus oxyrinchus]